MRPYGFARWTPVVALTLGAAGVGLAGRPLARSAPALAPLVSGDTQVVYGPKTFATPTGSATNHVERFAVAVTVVVSPDGSLYIVDNGVGRVRRVTPDGIIRTFAGSANTQTLGDGSQATLASLQGPWVLALGPDGSAYVTQTGGTVATGGCRIRRVAPSGIITTFVGTGFCIGSNTGVTWAGDGGPAPAAQLGNQIFFGLAVGPDGNLYVSDNNRVRKVAGFLPGFGAGETVIASEDGSELYVFSMAGRLLFTLNPQTRDTIYRFSYNEGRQLVTITDANGMVTSFERNSSGAVTAVVAPNGQRTGVTLDAIGHIAGLTGPDGRAVGFHLGASGMLVGAINQAGDTVARYAYEADGPLTGVTNALGGTTSYASTTTSTGGVVTMQLPSGRSFSVSSDQLPAGGGRFAEALGGMNVQTAYGLDGRVVITASDGSVTTLTPAPDSRFGMEASVGQESIRLPSGLTRTTLFSRGVTLSDADDPLSVAVEVDSTVVNGRVSTTRYDRTANTVVTTSAGGRSTVATLDSLGRVTRISGAGLPTFTRNIDAHGHVTASSVGGRITRYTYDSLDRIATITDLRGLQQRFLYDQADRLVRQQLPDGRVVGFGYDTNGNLSAITPPGRPSHSWTYSAAGLVRDYAAPDAGVGSPVTRYFYDSAGRVAQITRADSSVVRLAYDASGFNQTVIFPGGDTLSLSRDGASSNLSSATLTGGVSVTHGYDGYLLTNTSWQGAIQGSVTYAYNADFRVQTEQVNGGLSVQRTFDPDGLVTAVGALTLTRDPTTGAVTGTALGSVATRQTLTPSLELSTTVATFGADTLYASSLERDSIGRLVKRAETVGGGVVMNAFQYDSAGRLVAVTRNGVPAESYEYDENGNRIRATTTAATFVGTVDVQDRLTAYGNARYEYSTNGDLVRKIFGADTTSYTYDAIGNLRAVRGPGEALVEYLVDAEGRRVGKRVNGILVRGWLYDGPLAIVAELDGSGQLVSRFVYAEPSNVPEYMIREGVTYRIIVDERGSVSERALVGGDGYHPSSAVEPDRRVPGPSCEVCARLRHGIAGDVLPGARLTEGGYSGRKLVHCRCQWARMTRYPWARETRMT